jgi:hypothetical protein
MKPMEVIIAGYAIIAGIFVLIDVVYVRLVVCTEQSILGFFWCPEASFMAASIKALFWPLRFF